MDQCNHSEEWNVWRKKFERILNDAVRLWKRHSQCAPEIYQRRKERLKQRLSHFLEQPGSQDRDIVRLMKRLRRHRDELLTFLDHPEEASPYNNHAERQIRPSVITRRITQQNRSERGARTQAILMTIFRTLHLQNRNIVEDSIQLCKILNKMKTGSLNPSEINRFLFNFSKS